MKILLAPILLLLSNAQAAPVTSHFPTHNLGAFLAEKFDVTSIRSSLGPRRSAGQRTFADLNMAPSKATDQVLEFASPSWHYQFNIVARRDVNGDGIEDLEVCFIDRALGGPTYNAAQGLLITRYGAGEYAVALSFSVDACSR